MSSNRWWCREVAEVRDIGYDKRRCFDRQVDTVSGNPSADETAGPGEPATSILSPLIQSGLFGI